MKYFNSSVRDRINVHNDGEWRWLVICGAVKLWNTECLRVLCTLHRGTQVMRGAEV